MKRLLLLLGCVSLVPGCALLGHFGYYKHSKPDHAPPEAAAAITFPDTYEGGTRLDGAMMRALSVAMNDYLPPHVRAEDLEGPEFQCLARWENYRTVVMRASEDLIFVLFSPDLSTCAPGFAVPDAGAEYALDGQGRILARR
ncbi:hypothetical protein [Archangium primigenium]|uniref:hypothetical protein n=1 Tax=[Archangium] primigenium TaxID=2792470 RepID=UPI00195E8078|nr:hypothetical protein [Archangium primigenium]MBM7113538.1 hypothetical protein [Archangium primigenium]